MRHRAPRPLLDPLRRCAGVLKSRRTMYVAAPACALVLVAGSGVTSVDLADLPGEPGTSGPRGVNRAGAFAQASGTIASEPSTPASPLSTSSAANVDGKAEPGSEGQTGDPTSTGLPGTATPDSSADTSRPTPSRVSTPGEPTATTSAASPSEGPSPSGSPSSSGSPSPSPSGSPSSSPSSDGEPPETTIVSGPQDNSDEEFRFSADEPAGFECNLDGAGWETCSSGYQPSDLRAGWHTLSVRAIDSAGNVDPTPDTWEWHATGQ